MEHIAEGGAAEQGTWSLVQTADCLNRLRSAFDEKGNDIMRHTLPNLAALALVCVLSGCASLDNSPSLTRDESYPELIGLMQQLRVAKPDQRPTLLNHIKERLPAWYSGLESDPPDTSDPKWTTFVGYDLMPENEFQKKEEETRAIFVKMGQPFPENVTRRQLLHSLESLIGKMSE